MKHLIEIIKKKI